MFKSLIYSFKILKLFECRTGVCLNVDLHSQYLNFNRRLSIVVIFFDLRIIMILFSTAITDLHKIIHHRKQNFISFIFHV